MSEVGSLLSLEYGEAMPAQLRTGHGFPVFGSNGEVGRHSKFLIPGPGIIVGRKGSVGKVTWSEEPFWPIDTTYWVKCTPQDQRWCYWMLNWLPLARLDSSTGVPGLNRNDVYRLTVDPLGSREREAISGILDTIDIAIDETEALIVKLKAVKQGLLHDLLTRGIDANGELRPPRVEAPHLYTESPLGWIPKEWQISTVGTQFDIQLGKMLDVQKNSGALKPYLGNKAVQWDRIDFAEVQHVRMSQSDLRRFRLERQDLLVCEGGEVGRAAIWEAEMEECYYQKALHRLRPLRGYLPRLMLEWLRHHMSRDTLSEYISRTSIAHLTQEKLAVIPLPTPSLDEQSRVVSEVLAAKQREAAEESQLQKLRLLKSGLMDDLLTGRVRVTPLISSDGPQDG